MPNCPIHHTYTAPIKVTILGCGTSAGVPQVNNGWYKCNPNNPKNRRLRCSAYIETQNQQGDDVAFLVDTGPDLRQQLLTHNLSQVDAILYTHSHADHIAGLDEIRWLNVAMGKGIDAHMDAYTHDQLIQRFAYCMGDVKVNANGHKYYYKPVIIPHVHPYNTQVTICDVPMTTIHMNHGHMDAMGWRIGDFAYCTDVLDFTEDSFALLQGIRYWVIDCLRETPHSTHTHLERVLCWVDALKPEKTYLTHMNNELDYDHAMSVTPDHVEPAYDGLIIQL